MLSFVNYEFLTSNWQSSSLLSTKSQSSSLSLATSGHEFRPKKELEFQLALKTRTFQILVALQPVLVCCC